jgi:hypothetical protein
MESRIERSKRRQVKHNRNIEALRCGIADKSADLFWNRQEKPNGNYPTRAMPASNIYQKKQDLHPRLQNAKNEAQQGF